MINLVSCPVCFHANFVEAGALALHIDLMHDTHLAVPPAPPAPDDDPHAE